MRNLFPPVSLTITTSHATHIHLLVGLLNDHLRRLASFVADDEREKPDEVARVLCDISDDVGKMDTIAETQ